MSDQLDTINARLDEGDQRMARMEGQMAENTAITRRVDTNTAAIVEAFQTLQGAFKVLETLGKLAKPLAWIGAAEAGGERIQHRDARLFQLVEIEVEDGDFHHVGVVVEAGKGMLFEKFPLRWLEQPTVREAALQVCWFGVLPEDVCEG